MSLKVLIVDDSKLARMAVAKMLNNLRPQWQRVEATNADEASALSHQGAFDIALLDFNMPGRDGLELAAEFRSAKPDMIVGIISANVQTEIVSRAESIGADFLGKPLTEAAIGAFIVRAEQRLGTSSQ